jgi:flagellar biosynthesis anti-sigma factor FlgM
MIELRREAMDIRSSVDGLRNLLGVPSNGPEQPQQVKGEASLPPASLSGDHATVSSAGAEVASASSASDVRTDMVAQVQAAIANGEYDVSAGAVAGKLVDAMLSRGKLSAN